MTLRLPALLPGPSVTRSVVGHAARRLAVAEIGGPNAPAWVIAHGAGSSARFVASAFAEAVVARGGRLVVYDLRGHGDSDPDATRTGHHLDVHVADLMAVVQSTRGEVRVIGGISLGAHAAVRAVAAGAGGSALAAVVAGLPAWTGSGVYGSGPHAAIAAELRRTGVPASIERLRSAHGLHAWLRDTLLADHPRHDPGSLLATLDALDGGEAPGLDELASLRVPLVVAGWDDDPGHPLDVAREWAATAQRGQLVELELGDLDAGAEVLGRRVVAAVATEVQDASGR